MKTFGYAKQENLNGDGLMEMEEITISATKQELRKIAEFLIQCADALPDDETLGHEHYSDFIDKKTETDLIVVIDQN